MKTVAELKEKRAELLAEVEAIATVAKSENREPSAEESQRIDAVLGAGNVAGEVANLTNQIARAEKIEAAKRELLNSSNIGGPAPSELGANWAIPKSARRVAKLRSFAGKDAERTAYAFGQWFLGALGNEKSREWSKDHGYEFRNAMTEGFDSKGGYLVPEEFDASIVDLRNEYGVARRELEVVPMMSDTKVVPRRSAGLTAYPVGEASTITASDKTGDNIRLVAKKWGVIARYSSELAEDAVISIADDLASEIAYAFAYAEDNSAFNGDGTSTYSGNVGFKNALLAGSKVTAATGNTSFGELDLADFHAMTAKAANWAWRAGGPKWYISRAGYAASMERLQIAAGGNVVADVANGGVPRFLGYPVVFCDIMNTTLGAQTSTDGLAYFGNARLAAKLGDRRGMALAQSTDVYFTTDEIAIRGTERFDIVVHDIGTASVSGSMIMLSTPGS
jgi:HK97 family phage major capsid protein